MIYKLAGVAPLMTDTTFKDDRHSQSTKYRKL